MKYFASLLFGLSLTLPASALTPTTVPADGAVASPDASTDPLLGKTFRSRIGGIEFNPPAGGTLMRELNSGELVRFTYPDTNWDVRVKPIVLGKPLALTSGIGDGGVLEMTVAQIKAENATANVLTQKVVAGSKGAKPYGLIETRYNAGTDVIFAQEAIIEDNDRHYFALQMSSPGKPKAAAAGIPDPKETEAQTMFQHVIASVKVLDRRALLAQQEKAIYQTTLLWVDTDRKKIVGAMQPQHFMRVIQAGKDIGFVQIDERLASHGGFEGIEFILHSRVVEAGADQVMDAARTLNGAQGGTSTSDGSAGSASIVVPKELSRGPLVPIAPAKPTNLYTNSVYFTTFDRKHEDWTTTTQVDQQVASQLTEEANANVIEKRMPDAAKLAAAIKAEAQLGVKNHDIPMIEVPDGKLEVSQYSRGRRVGEPVKEQLPPYYLPQVLGQMLPRLLPKDPTEYAFGSYVSSQKKLLFRYVDVGRSEEVTLDGQQFNAIPISDRIGVDGIPTIHYVTRQGEWLGSVNENAKLQVLPTDAKTLAEIWKSDPHGFAVCPLPPTQDEDPGKQPIAPVIR